MQLKYLVFILLPFVFLSCVSNKSKEYIQESGKVFGTYYRVVYQSDTAHTVGINNAMDLVNTSLSTFNKQSTISKVNNNDSTVVLDSLFIKVFSEAQRISEITGGCFDITVAPLVKAWGFGYNADKKGKKVNVDSILNFVGYKKVRLQNNKILKDNQSLKLDCSAIAKGFGCDMVADYLRSQGIENFLVDIGGELVVSGINAKGENWRIGINKAVEDSTQTNLEIQEVLPLTNCAIATSGNYRQYYTTKDRKVGHTINPITGMPEINNVLSATVIAKNCMIADAYATAFMVMGDTIKIKNTIMATPDSLKVFLIYNLNGQHTEIEYEKN